MSTKKNIVSLAIIFLILSLFFRVDFRFKTTVECCSDDYDYFSHAQTIAIDYDFDYSNQLPETHPYVYKNNFKITPVGYPGTGILSSPFLFLGNFIDKNFSNSDGSEILNYSLLLYSISPIFYFFIGFKALVESINLLKINFNKYKLLILISGSGLSYFAFERFSMTHVFEFFIISILIKHCIKFYKNNNNLSSVIIPPILMVSYLVRMSNLYVFLLPLIIKSFVMQRFNSENKLIKRSHFIVSSIITFIFYTFISNLIYGKLIINPQEVYGSNVSINSLTTNSNSLIDFLLISIKDILNIFFGNEFGIAWVSPIIFSGLVLSIYSLKNIKNFGNWLILICFAQNFFVILIWRSTGASYGFRYLYSLVPLCIVIFYLNKEIYTNNIFFKLIFFTSVFSNLAIIFFETTEQTALSMDEIKNSFGIIRRYSAPYFVTGVLKSITEFDSYLIIITTSFVGIMVFKILLLFFDKLSLINLLAGLGLPTENTDFLNYLDIINELSNVKVLLLTAFLLRISFFIVYKINSEIKNV